MTLDEMFLEEWKQNVALYIDQDRRGFARIQVFLTIQGALFVLYGLCWKEEWTFASFLLALIVAGAGLGFSFITHQMSYRAHAFILLRKIHGLLIERKLNSLLADERQKNTAGSVDPIAEVKTCNGMIATFLREKICFGDTDPSLAAERETLLGEVKSVSERMLEPLTNKGRFSWGIGHLDWLIWMYKGLYVSWSALVLCAIIAYFNLNWCSIMCLLNIDAL